jgi:hypothetical protein
VARVKSVLVWLARSAGACSFAFTLMRCSVGVAQGVDPSWQAPTAVPAAGATTPASEAAGEAEAPVPSWPLDEALSLEEGATCLDRERLVRRVARWLQRDQVDATLKVEVHGDARDARKIAFVIDRGAGDRALRTIDDGPADCDQLHAALALSIALAIDANLGLGGASAPDLPDDEALVARKPEPSYLKLGAALMLHATSGLLTDISAGASARIEAGFMPWLDLRLGVLGSTVDGQTIRDVTEGTFSARLLAGRADGCVAHALGKLRLMACAGAMAGVFTAEGHGFEGGSGTDNRAWAALVGGFELQAELARWLSLAAAVDLVVPFGSRKIQVLDALERPSSPRTLTSVAVLVGAGPVLRFF